VFYNEKYADFYLNVGSANNPDFVLQPSSSNPLDFLSSEIMSFRPYSSQPFVDFDGDGDFDFTLDGPTSALQYYYENTGDSAHAVFTSTSVPVLDSTFNGAMDQTNGNNHQYGHYSFVDIDGDGDLDVFEFDFLGDILNYYENMEIMLNVEDISSSKLSLSVAPNPSNGNINFEASYNGQLFVYGIAGRLLKRIDMVHDNSVDLSDIDNGTYYLVLDADKKRYQTTLVLQK
jgi:hypothetical protein